MPPKISKEIKLSQIQESKTRVVVCIAIHFAASRGNVVKIKELCSEARRLGRDILKLADPNGSTALHIAAFYGQVESIKVLCAEAGDKKFELLKVKSVGGQTPLHQAASEGHAKAIEALLAEAGDKKFELLKVKSVGGQTPLDQAAYKGHAKAIEALLAEAGDKKFELLTIKSAGGRTPLHQAAQYNKLGAIKELLKLTLNQKKNLLKAATDSGHTALHLAAQEGNAEVIRDLCLAAGDKKEGLLKAATEDGHTALHLAATQGHAAAIKALCDAADDQEQKEALFKPVTKQGMTALHAAAHNGHVEAIKALCALCIEAGDQKQKEKLLTAATDAGHTALHLAAKHGHAAAITALLAEAGDLKQKIELLKAKAINWDGYTALHYAAEYGHLDVIEELFLAAGCQKGELLKVFTTKKLTVLHLAATFGHVAAIKAIFIAAGDQKQREALLEAVDIDGDTALHLAAQHGEAEVIQALSLAAGDKKEKLLNAADMRGYRALHLAAQNGHVKAIDALCKEAGDQKQREALLEAVDNAGDTALHLAAYCGNAAAIKVLCEVAGDQKQELLKSDKMDATPLHYAAQNGHVKAIEALCEEAGDQKQKEEMLKAATRSDQTALHLAATQGHVGVIEYLLAMAGDIKEELLNAVNMDGNTALHEAAHNGHADAIISLFEKAGDQEQKEALLKSANKSGHKALDLAARCGNTAAIKALCEAAGDKKNELLKAVNKDNLTALHLAAKHGHAAAITAILAEAGDQKQELLKAVYNNGLTALYVAAYNNNIEATNELYVEALKAGVKKEELLKVDSEKGRKLLINLRDEKVAISLIEFISESSRKKLLNASLVNENYHLYQNPEIKNIYMLVMAVDGMPLDGIEAVNFKDMPEEFPRDLKEALKLTDEQAHTAIEIVTEYNKKNRSPTAEGTTFHDLIAPYKINYVSKLKTLDCAIELLDRGFLNEIPSGNEDSVELLESKVSSNAAIPAKKSPEAASVVGFAPETLRKPVSKTCSAPSLSASMGILGKRQSELLKDKVSDGVNLCYQYEDYDIAAILNIRLAQEVTAPGELGGDGRIQVLAPTDGLSPGILEMQLRENREQFTGARVVIIPYNVGHYHWIGILLEFSAENLITRALHIDSSGRNELETLQNRLNRAGYRYQEGVALSPVTLLTQTDGTSCGAYTIENLILALINQGVPNPPPTAEMIRRKHITCLETYRPEFYRGDSGFYQRQLENRITALNTGFNRGETSSVVFSPFELRKILDVSQLIEKFSNEVLRKQLWQALQPQAAYQDNIKLHLDAIRKTIKALARSLSAPEEESADKDNLRDLIEILFGTSWTIGKEVTDEQLDSFCVDYEQIKAIAKRKDTKAASPEQTEIKNKILEQIKSDEEFAKKLQSQFYSEKIDAVVVTGNMHTIPTQAVHRLFTGGDDIVPSVAEIPAEVDNLGEKLVPDTDFRKVSGAKPSADEVSGDFLAGIASSNDSASAKEKKVDEIKERVETHLRYLGLTNSPIFKDSYNQLVNISLGNSK